MLGPVLIDCSKSIVLTLAPVSWAAHQAGRIGNADDQAGQDDDGRDGAVRFARMVLENISA